MALAAPHRWVVTRDFLVDLNGTKDFKMTVDDCCDRCYGSCGLPPDAALMQKEGTDPFDLRADQNNWTPAQRKIELWVNDRISTANRIQWLNDQVHESLITGQAPLNLMTQKEQGVFLWLLREARLKRKVRAERQQKIWKRYHV